MLNRGRFHRKKITNVREMIFSGEERRVSVALRLRNVAEKTHCATNRCNAARHFAETSRFSPGL
jgi:hypothetical protein